MASFFRYKINQTDYKWKIVDCTNPVEGIGCQIEVIRSILVQDPVVELTSVCLY